MALRYDSEDPSDAEFDEEVEEDSEEPLEDLEEDIDPDERLDIAMEQFERMHCHG